MRRWLAALAALGLITTAVAWLLGPTPQRLADTTTGDPALAESVRAVIADPTGYHGLAVARTDADQTSFAGLGEAAAGEPVEPDTAFEVGSIGKVLTGMLLADLAADGVVDPDQPLGELLPAVDFDDPAVAEITLAELASHRSGLPRLRMAGLRTVLNGLTWQLRGGDPYAGQDVDWLAATLPSATVSAGEPAVDYSNYGMALLGYALAEHTGVPYPELVRQRILDPLGMSATSYHLDGDPLPAHRAAGGTADGRTMAPWQGSGYAAAGIGLWSTADDLATLVAAVSDGTAPGADAATARFEAGPDEHVGYGWFTDLVNGDELTWHNGASGGFRSYVGFEPATGQGVVVLGNTDRDVVPLGQQLLTQAGDPVDRAGVGWYAIVVTLVVSCLGGLSLLFLATRPEIDRLRLVSNGAWAMALPAIAYQYGAWSTVPALVWALGVGVSVVALAQAVRRWPAVPVVAGRFRWLRWVASTLLALAAPLLVLWFYT
ncbi:beta-lactamase family protein [Natronosporangium hydrolyticum]|uniref:Beta-lactamase family protein n=1 Tax=Natronosporangium hydrolyticum TaxID=2811111 RepID=A0A895YHE5_9ACTN|nr:serine hydrolase domain-containing protein [Natronosporangium hydrolyticum]QSB13138.1 beta-lactamase family protein [Natronosporangium hydrolyticum]